MSLTIENTQPGVTVLVNQSQVGSVVKRQPTSTAFAVGYSPWGPVDLPTTVTSWADYVRRFGSFNANSYLAVFCYIFFNLFKGAQAVICRVVGAAAVVATRSLLDRAGAPIATLRVDAKWPSSTVDVRVTVEPGTTANTVKLTFRSVALGVREMFDNFDLSAAAITEINQKSQLVNLTNLASATAAPNNLPALLAESFLTGGNDDFAGINSARYIGTVNGSTKTGLRSFDDELLGTGQVAIPGITAPTVHAALVAHAEAYHRLALLDPPLASDTTAVLAIRALYGTWYAALAWPWFEARDFAGSELKKFYPPSAAMAGACAQADRTVGTHKAPANYVIPEALDVERAANGQTQADEGALELLNGKDVNVILRIPEGGIRVYGARVMTADRRVQMMHEIRLLNLFYYSLKIAYRYAVFSVVDGGGRLFRELASVANTFLRGFWRDGALYGKREEDAFAVVCNDSNNPPAEVSSGRVHVDVGVKLSQTAETIIIKIDNVPLAQDLSVLQQQ
ncbi:MAG: phage tail sheath subtilisin-like domain-containing protein [Acidobacteria bacterium]|nr:phage tail sheath subtilisin-like domain-containing protein [Acidobacteriota bacterium]